MRLIGHDVAAPGRTRAVVSLAGGMLLLPNSLAFDFLEVNHAVVVVASRVGSSCSLHPSYEGR